MSYIFLYILVQDMLIHFISWKLSLDNSFIVYVYTYHKSSFLLMIFHQIWQLTFFFNIENGRYCTVSPNLSCRLKKKVGQKLPGRSSIFPNCGLHDNFRIFKRYVFLTEFTSSIALFTSGSKLPFNPFQSDRF